MGISGFVQPTDKLRLVVGLPHLDVKPELLAQPGAALRQVGMRGRAVHLRLAHTEPTEVRAIKDEHADELHIHPLTSP